MDQAYILRLEKIEEILRFWLRKEPDPRERLWMDPVFSELSARVPPELLKSLTLPGWDLLNRGGKRWRPLLMTLICEALGGGDNALPLTPLVEFPHNASLIHDDIEDNSDTRRGEPAVHIRYGEDAAVNAGTFLYFLPLACLDRWSAPVGLKYAVLEQWSLHLRRLHLGQAMDIQWHKNPAVLPAITEYNLMCRLKTGSLARLAAVLGGLASNLQENLTEKKPEIIKEFAETAETIGIGFQILDDVKNLVAGNPGKKRGDDIAEGKKSLPILLYLHRRPDRREFAERCFSAAKIRGTTAPEVEDLIGALTADGVIAEAEAEGRAYIDSARTLFSREKSLLSGFLPFLL
ncbi:MAG: polyprenyl synthetase family protein [Spirochaetaceae bacterium]|nr:polyprenyl synthetase family protein [Spirochaetaceae bacterium]